MIEPHKNARATLNVGGFEPYRGRRLDMRADTWVYRNLMRGDGVWYSLMQHGCVVGHCRSVILRDARFVVREGGRRRVLALGVKNVHAFVVGRLVWEFACLGSSDPAEQVKYKPMIFSTFVDAVGAAVHKAVLVTLSSAGVFAENAT